jgi:heme exporter protein D
MIWNSWGEFFAMGGYALYVWGSMVVVFVLMLGEVVGLALRWKANLAHLKQRPSISRRTSNENKA